MNVLKELLHSIYKLESYPVFMKDRNRKTFLFGFLLVFLYFVATVFIPLMRYPVTPGRLERLLDQKVPEFVLQDQNLTVDGEVKYKNSGTYIFINTEDIYIQESEIETILQPYRRALVIDSEMIVYKSNGGGLQIYHHSDIDPEISFTKADLLNLLDEYAIVLILGLIGVLLVILIFMEFTFFFAVLFVALPGMIVASCMHQNLSFGQLYKLGIYTRTTPLIIKALLSFLPIWLPFYFLISIVISLAYMAGAIKNIQAPPLTDGPLVFSSDRTGPIDEQDPFY